MDTVFNITQTSPVKWTEAFLLTRVWYSKLKAARRDLRQGWSWKRSRVWSKILVVCSPATLNRSRHAQTLCTFFRLTKWHMFMAGLPCYLHHPVRNMHVTELGLARSVYIYTVRDRKFGDFPAKNTVFAPYICTVHILIWFWPAPNPKHSPPLWYKNKPPLWYKNKNNPPLWYKTNPPFVVQKQPSFVVQKQASFVVQKQPFFVVQKQKLL